jgi:hypothetical protein
MMMNVERSVEWELGGETEVLEGNLPQCHFVHHKSHMTWPELEPGRRGGKPATNRLSYDTASLRGSNPRTAYNTYLGEWTRPNSLRSGNGQA